MLVPKQQVQQESLNLNLNMDAMTAGIEVYDEYEMDPFDPVADNRKMVTVGYFVNCFAAPSCYYSSITNGNLVACIGDSASEYTYISNVETVVGGERAIGNIKINNIQTVIVLTNTTIYNSKIYNILKRLILYSHENARSGFKFDNYTTIYYHNKSNMKLNSFIATHSSYFESWC